MDFRNFFGELKRRNVYKVGIAYIAVSWLLAQVASILLPTFEAPGWVMKTVVLLLLIGFPISLILAWAFELTPEGIRKTGEVDRAESITSSTGRQLNRVIIGVMALAIILLYVDRFASKNRGLASVSPLIKTTSVSSSLKNKRVAVIPFDNQTNADDLENMGIWAADHITSQLMRLEDIQVTRFDNVQRNARFVSEGSQPGSEFAHATGADVVIKGRYYLQEQNIIIYANIANASTGADIYSFEAIRGRRDDPQSILENLTQKILGFWAVKDVRKFDKRSPRYDAYVHYVEGNKIFLNDPVKSEYHLLKALELDSSFYQVYFKLYHLYAQSDLGKSPDSIHRIASQFELDFNPWERSRFNTQLAAKNGDRKSAAQENYKLFEIDFFDYISNHMAAYSQLICMNNPGKALEILSVYPDKSEMWENWMEAYYMLGQYEEAISLVDSFGDPPELYLEHISNHMKTLVRSGKEEDIEKYLNHYVNSEIIMVNVSGSGEPWVIFWVCSEADITSQNDLKLKYAQRLLNWSAKTDDDRALYFAGMANYWMEDYARAISTFQKDSRQTFGHLPPGEQFLEKNNLTLNLNNNVFLPI